MWRVWECGVPPAGPASLRSLIRPTFDPVDPVHSPSGSIRTVYSGDAGCVVIDLSQFAALGGTSLSVS